MLRDYQLDPEEIKSGLVGQTSVPNSKGTDGGIDAIYLLVNGRLIRDLDQAQDLKALKQNIVFDVVVIQSSLESGFGLDRLIRLKDTSENIFRTDREADKFAEAYNEELLDCIRRFRETHRALITKHPTFNVSYLYLTRGDTTKVAPDVANKAKQIEQDLPRLLATVSEAIASVDHRSASGTPASCQQRSRPRAVQFGIGPPNALCCGTPAIPPKAGSLFHGSS